MSAVTGRKNKVLSMSEKIRLIQNYEDGLSVRQLQEQFQCGKTQIYETLKRRQDIRAEYGDAFQDRGRHVSKSGRETVGGVVDSVVWTWFAEARSKGMAVTGSMLRDKARNAALKLDRPGFEASTDWLDAFLKRHSVSSEELTAERTLVRATDMQQILSTRSLSVEALDQSGDSSMDPACQETSQPDQEDAHLRGGSSGAFVEALARGGGSPFAQSDMPSFSFPVLHTKSLDEDAHEHFIRFVDSTLRSITPDYRKDIAKLEIQQVLVKYKHSVDVPLGQPTFTSLPSSTTADTT